MCKIADVIEKALFRLDGVKGEALMEGEQSL
jgi:hypothetical protein